MGSDYQNLSYPLYLDVSMMISFLASLDDGVSYDASVQRTSGSRRDGSGEIEGGARLPAFLSLLPFDLRGRITGEFSSEDAEVLNLVKRHTEASLFNKLRTMLHDRDMVIVLSDDEGPPSTIHPGAIVELNGVIARNPLEQLVNIMQRIRPFAQQQPQSTSHPAATPRAKGGRNENRPVQTIQHQVNQPDPWTFLGWMKEDLESADMIDVILNVEGGPVDKCILTLSQEFGTGRTADSLLGAQVRVVGKVTRLVESGEAASLVRRVILGLLPRDQVNAMFLSLNSNPMFENVLSQLEIAPPYIQILPLAVFV